MENKKEYIQGVLSGAVVMLLVCAIAGSVLFRQFANSNTDTKVADTSDKQFENVQAVVNDSDVQEKMRTIAKILDNGYYEDIDMSLVETYLYKGLVYGTNDPYSAYYTPEEVQKVNESISGTYYGIGVTMSLDENTGLAQIIKVADESPAKEAGVKVDDLIYKINGENVTDSDLSNIAALVRGEEGSTVDLTLIRNNSDYVDLTVSRADIETKTVSYQMMEDHIGYILVSAFDEVTSDQFASAVEDLQGQGMQSLILDLRDNPGGRVDVANDMAEYLLPKGVMTYIEDKYGQRQDFTCNGEKTIDKPMVVLVNGNSASASEIIAGAIKDDQVGTLIGTKTYGKGIVQTTTSLSDGSAVKFTFAKYYTPNGENIHGIGIEPDQTVELDSINSEQGYSQDTDNQLKAAIDFLKK